MKIEVHINETLPLLNCNKKKFTSRIPARGAVQEVLEKESGMCSYIYQPDILQQVQSREKVRGFMSTHKLSGPRWPVCCAV